MNPDLARPLAARGGVLTRTQALAAVPRWVLEHAVRSGDLVRVLPQVYVHEPRQRDPIVLRRAALAYSARRGVLSHTSALAAWGLHSPVVSEPVHVTVPADVRLRSAPSVIVHRRRGPLVVRARGGLRVTALETTLVDAWPLLPREVRRAPLIEAVGCRMTTPHRVAVALAGAPRLPGRRELAVLLDRLGAGCRSMLEIWGLEHVFAGAGMPPFVRQHPVRLGRQTVYLDVFAPAEQVDFELDGATWHGASGQRERDLRRDAALASVGIAVVRFAYRRLVAQPVEVRREVLAILAARWLGGA